MNAHAIFKAPTLVIFASVLVLCACRSAPDRLTYDNYSRIAQQGSTQSEVTALLGEPTNRLGQQWMYERPKQHLLVFVDFDESGHVSRKQWVDATTGTWDDTKNGGDPPGTVQSRTTHSHEN